MPTHEEESRYSINSADAEIREGYATADPDRILSAYADRFGDMSDGVPSFGGTDAPQVLRARLEALFALYRVQCIWITMEILVLGDVAVSYGWQELLLTPISGGPSTLRRTRLIRLWKRGEDAAWRIALFLNNQDHPQAFAADTIAALRAL